MPADDPGFPTDFYTKVAATAQGRAQGWQAIAQCLQVPSVEFVQQLRDGTLAQLWTDSAAWLGDDRHMLTGELMSLGVFARGAKRRDFDSDVQEFTADHTAVVGDQKQLIADLISLSHQCEAESAAWAQNDIAAGKLLRAQQNLFLDQRIATDLTELCVRIVEGASLNIWNTLAKMILAYLSADTGKDYQRAALGSRRKSGGMVDEKGFLRLYEQT